MIFYKAQWMPYVPAVVLVLLLGNMCGGLCLYYWWSFQFWEQCYRPKWLIHADQDRVSRQLPNFRSTLANLAASDVSAYHHQSRDGWESVLVLSSSPVRLKEYVEQQSSRLEREGYKLCEHKDSQVVDAPARPFDAIKAVVETGWPLELSGMPPTFRDLAQLGDQSTVYRFLRVTDDGGYDRTNGMLLAYDSQSKLVEISCSFQHLRIDCSGTEVDPEPILLPPPPLKGPWPIIHGGRRD
jgi:hypothetical protein